MIPAKFVAMSVIGNSKQLNIPAQRMIVALFCLAAIAFCLLFLAHDHTYLRNWYLSLGGCLYRQQYWEKDFFSPAVKAAGNHLAIAGCIVSAGLAVVTFSAKRTAVWHFNIERSALPYYAIAGIGALIAAIYAQRLSCPAYDEVFSAVNCAELHPFQTISYYMLPNNHIYFNAVNNVLCGWWHDPVTTGRWISTIAYCGAMLAACYCFRQWLASGTGALIALLPVAMQLTTLGMAGQARGYEVQLLCGWLTVAGIDTYLRNNSNAALKLVAVSSIAGFAMTTSYLLFYLPAALFLFVASGRKGVWPVLRYQFITGAVVFLLYLPALCFSGVGAFTANRYVAPGTDTIAAFLPQFASLTRFFIRYCFSMIGGEDNPVSYILFSLPVVLLFSKTKQDRLIGVAFVAVWVSYAAITLQMRHMPFNRNLIVQFSISMGCTIYALFRIVQWLPGIGRWQLLAFAIPVVGLTAYLVRASASDIPYKLYYNAANDIYHGHEQELGWISRDASIGCSDECFLTYYMFRQLHPKAVKCATGAEDYYIKRKDDPMPAGWELRYEKWKDGSEDYEYYKRCDIQADLHTQPH